MKARLAVVPFHILLLPFFFIIHTANAYKCLLPWTFIAQGLLQYLAASVILWLAGLLIFKSAEKAGLWATGLLIPFFFFGAFHDLIKGWRLPSVLSSYSLLLPVLMILYAVLTIYIKRTGRPLRKPTLYLTTLFVILAGIETIHLVYNLVTSDKKQRIPFAAQPVLDTVMPRANNQLPDIFFIVFDEFASSESLKRYFNYNNSVLDSSLARNGFYVARQSKSNYNNTPLSIASTLGMQYFDTPLEQHPTTPMLMLHGWKTLAWSRMPDMLAGAGYKIHNFGLCDFNNYPSPEERYHAGYERKVLHDATLWGRIKRDILWNLEIMKWPFLKTNAQKKMNDEKHRFVTRNRSNMQRVLNDLKIQDDQPKFVFCHIMMPHAPFYFDRNGNYTDQYSVIYNYKNEKRPYFEQLLYTNRWIDSLAKAASQSFPRPRVVIIEGDHGFREEVPQPVREMHFMNLNTFYFSDRDYSSLYDSISPVNTFRVVFNKYFNAGLPLLTDSTIMLQ